MALTHLEKSFSRVQSRLRRTVGDEVYNSWFGRLQLDDMDEADGMARLSVPTPFLKVWIKKHYESVVLECCKAEYEVNRIELSVRGSMSRDACVKKDPDKHLHVRRIPAPLLVEERPVVSSPPLAIEATAFETPVQDAAGASEAPHITVDRVISEVVSFYWEVTKEDIKSRRGRRHVVEARHVALYLAYALVKPRVGKISYSYLARERGGLDHTSVQYAQKRVAWLIGERGNSKEILIGRLPDEIDEKLKRKVEWIRSRILQTSSQQTNPA